MILSDTQIKTAMLAGDVVISPFDEKNLGNCSYDVRLGEWYYRSLLPPLRDDVFNIYDNDHVKKVWGVCLKAVESCAFYDNRTDLNISRLKNIKPTDKVIMIDPGETILAHTQEFIGGKNNKTTMMKARSSFGRCFIQVCHCSGWGDIGYVNRWTMEISNNSMHHTIPLVVGRRIAQIVFMEAGHSSSYDGKYQSSSSVEELRRNWKPEDMLPKLHLDKDIHTGKEIS